MHPVTQLLATAGPTGDRKPAIPADMVATLDFGHAWGASAESVAPIPDTLASREQVSRGTIRDLDGLEAHLTYVDGESQIALSDDLSLPPPATEGGVEVGLEAAPIQSDTASPQGHSFGISYEGEGQSILETPLLDTMAAENRGESQARFPMVELVQPQRTAEQQLRSDAVALPVPTESETIQALETQSPTALDRPADRSSWPSDLSASNVGTLRETDPTGRIQSGGALSEKALSATVHTGPSGALDTAIARPATNFVPLNSSNNDPSGDTEVSGEIRAAGTDGSGVVRPHREAGQSVVFAPEAQREPRPGIGFGPNILNGAVPQETVAQLSQNMTGGPVSAGLQEGPQVGAPQGAMPVNAPVAQSEFSVPEVKLGQGALETSAEHRAARFPAGPTGTGPSEATATTPLALASNERTGSALHSAPQPFQGVTAGQENTLDLAHRPQEPGRVPDALRGANLSQPLPHGASSPTQSEAPQSQLQAEGLADPSVLRSQPPDAARAHVLDSLLRTQDSRGASETVPGSRVVAASREALRANTVPPTTSVAMTQPAERTLESDFSTPSSEVEISTPVSQIRSSFESAPMATRLTPVATPQAGQVMQSVVQAVNDRKFPIEIALDPPELGSVRISILSSESSVSFVVHTDRPETADLMRRHVAMLQDALAERSGTQVNVSFSNTGEGGDARRDANSNPNHPELDGVVLDDGVAQVSTVARDQAHALIDGRLDLKL